jgi:hypothetical protein
MRFFNNLLKKYYKKEKIPLKKTETLPKIEEIKEKKKRTFSFSRKDIINIFGRWIRITSNECIVCNKSLRRNNDHQIVHYCSKTCRKNKNHTMGGKKHD